MSFRWFIYYCAVCGGAAAFVGWALGEPLGAGVMPDALKALFLGMMIGVALAVIDSLWSSSKSQIAVAGLRAVVAGLVGCVAGFFGALIGSGLLALIQKAFHDNPPAFLGGVVRVFGWTLTGLLIGASVGVFDLLVAMAKNQDPAGPLKKVINGLIGGAVGGLLGGLLFVLFMGGLGSAFSSLPGLVNDLWSPAAIGFVVLGLFIGLLIGLTQVILKQAWLKVEKGFRPGRELIVSKEQVVIGRGEGCDIGLFGDNGVERQHARILRKGAGYLLVDAGTPGGTYLNGQRIGGPTPLRAGDEIGVGKSVIRFGERQKR